MKRLWDDDVSSTAIGRQFKCGHSLVLFHIGRLAAKQVKFKLLKDVLQPVNESITAKRKGIVIRPPKPPKPPKVKKIKPIKVKHPKPITYKSILKTILTKKFIRDKKGIIIRIESIPYKAPSRWLAM